MATRLPSLSALRAFEAAARLRSFKKAAEELSVTATAISHRIRVLEEFLERPLFVRKVRAVELTADGQALFAAVRDGFEIMAAAIERLRETRRAAVTLSTTPAFAMQWLIPRLADFQRAHPDIDLHVHASNDPVDLDTGVADLAIRYGHGHYEGAIVTPLLQDRFAPVASSMIDAVDDADPAQWPLIHFDWHRSPPADLTWHAWAVAANKNPADFSAGSRFSEESHAIQAAIAGRGVALLSTVLVCDELQRGLLRRLPGPVLEGMAYYILKSVRRPATAAVDVVANWLIQIAG